MPECMKTIYHLCVMMTYDYERICLKLKTNIDRDNTVKYIYIYMSIYKYYYIRTKLLTSLNVL